LLTGGTLARAAAAGHRVVLVVATAGERGLTDATFADGLATRRMHELERAAEALGIARVVPLGYGDSGFPQPIASSRSFASVPIERVAADVAEVLEQERADVLTTYDAHGGYGHPDHVQVHRAGHVAARLAGTPVVLQATVPREAIQRAMRIIGRLGLRPGGFSAADFAAAFTPKREITHAVDVRRLVRQKRAAMAAHVSQAAGGADVRTLALLLRLPRPLFRLALGREWFVEPGRAVTGVPTDDVFATLREVRA
jgi:LmbE family N-acetylglucosaminyl deacetylase